MANNFCKTLAAAFFPKIDSSDCFVCVTYPMFKLGNYLGLSFTVCRCEHLNPNEKNLDKLGFTNSKILSVIFGGWLIFLVITVVLQVQDLILIFNYDARSISIMANLLYTTNAIIMFGTYANQYKIR